MKWLSELREILIESFDVKTSFVRFVLHKDFWTNSFTYLWSTHLDLSIGISFVSFGEDLSETVVEGEEHKNTVSHYAKNAMKTMSFLEMFCVWSVETRVQIRIVFPSTLLANQRVTTH